MKTSSLILKVATRYASSNPHVAYDLVELATKVAQEERTAMEFSTPEALKEYLKEHPKADPKNHSVTKNDHASDANTKVKVPKELGKDIGTYWYKKPKGNPVDAVKKLIDSDQEVPKNMLDKAVRALHDEARKPGINSDLADSLRGIRDKLEKHYHGE